MRGKSKSGDLYFYFLCRGRQDHICDLPYLPVAQVEDAIERYYATIAIPADIRARITESLDNVMAASSAVNDERRTQIERQLAKLDQQEDQYLDLVGDPDWPKDKLTKRIRDIRDEQARLQRQLDQTHSPDFETGRAALETALELLIRPDELYRLASKRARRVLNQALFTRLYIDADEAGPTVAANEPTEPFAPLLSAYTTTEDDSGGTAQPGDPTATNEPSTLLRTALEGQCSSNAAWVGTTGFRLNPALRRYIHEKLGSS
jgi:site-specific DNA recombinase